MTDQSNQTDLLLTIANRLDVSIDAIQFVQHLLFYCGCLSDREPGDVFDVPDPYHVTAAQMCEAVGQYASDFFEGDGQTVIEGWGIRTSEDIGRIVFALVEEGLVVTAESDRPEDFQGLRLFT